MALVVLICVGGILCLTPLSLYMRWLGSLNRRETPTVVPGNWDFVALLAGLSGFLIFGGGVLVAALQSNVRFIFRGSREQLESVIASEKYAWAATAGAYLLVLVGIVGIAALYRSRALAVYNLSRQRAAEVIEGALTDLGLAGMRSGDLWSDGGPLVEIQPFDGVRHVTVWLVADDPRRRQDLERAIRTRLAAVPAADNPAAAFVSTAATTLGCACVSFVVMIAYFVYTATH